MEKKYLKQDTKNYPGEIWELEIKDGAMFRGFHKQKRNKHKEQRKIKKPLQTKLNLNPYIER